MLIFVIILIGILLLQLKVAPAGEFFDDYSAPKQTATINGIFTILIFLSHSSQYVNLSSVIDKPYTTLQNFLGQLVVASFLFYSGFGIMQSISKKGRNYVKTLPSKRLFKVWYHFAIVVVLYIIVNLIFNRHYDISANLLAFVGYKSIGNSNWYLFITFAMYIIIFISFMICKKSKLLGIILTTALTFAFAYFEYKIGLENRYFNTIFCYPSGMLFSLIKPYFDKFTMKNDIVWAGSFLVVFVAFYYFHANRYDYIAFHNLQAIFAVVLIMLITMKLKIGNEILDFFGKHIFSFFILQRLPMIALYSLGYNKHPYGFIVLSFIATVFIAMVYDKVVDIMDKLIYKK